MRLLCTAISGLALLGAQAAPSTAAFTDFSYRGSQPAYRDLKIRPDQAFNPIIAGSRSDPTITRVGRDYYLSNTSFGEWPGAPIWRSRDLVNWKLIGHAFTHPDAPDLSKNDPAWQGVWANDLKHHDGWFYLSGVCYACGGIFAMRSRDPARALAEADLPAAGRAWTPPSSSTTTGAPTSLTTAFLPAARATKATAPSGCRRSTRRR